MPTFIVSSSWMTSAVPSVSSPPPTSWPPWPALGETNNRPSDFRPLLRSSIVFATTQPLTALTAGDLMSRDMVSVAQETPLREAGRLLLLHQISGLPVVEAGGACVGVL